MEESILLLLKDHIEKRNAVKTNLSKIISYLDHIDSSKAVHMSEWLSKKASYYKQQGLGNSPRDIKKGDIVMVELGYNVGDELSDDEQNCHFVLVWARKGFLFVGIPLTSTSQEGNEFGINLGKIDKLPMDTDSWVKLEAMRSLSIKRVQWMDQCENGKITLDKASSIMIKIKNKMLEIFV